MAREIRPQVAYWIDFNSHLVPSALGLPIPPAAAAAMYGLDRADYEAYLEGIQAELDTRAEVLLARPLWPEDVDGLPVPPSGTVLAIGDSITTYRHGYAELLKALLAQRRPEDGIRVLNGGYSGYTSAQGLAATYSYFLANRPDLCFIAYGGNDCKRFGGPEGKAQVSLAEFRANLEAIVAAFSAHTQAQLVMLTPAPVVERLVNASAETQARPVTWSNADVERYAQAVRELGENHRLAVVDLVEAFGVQPDPWLYLPDGLHPNLEGQQLILEQCLRAANERGQR